MTELRVQLQFSNPNETTWRALIRMDRCNKMAEKERERKEKKINNRIAGELTLFISICSRATWPPLEIQKRGGIMKIVKFFLHTVFLNSVTFGKLRDVMWMFSSFVDYSSLPVLQFTSVGVRHQVRYSNKSETPLPEPTNFCRSSEHAPNLQEQGVRWH